MPLGANKAAIMGVSGTAAAGDVVLLSSQTISADATIEFTSGINSTYGEYIFKFYNIHPASDDKILTFQCSIDSGSNYNVTVTSTAFRAYLSEADGGANLSYATSDDQAQGTAYQRLSGTVGNGSDESIAGILHLFNPASTTYVKHWYARTNTYLQDNGTRDLFCAGYFNDTNDIDAIQFKMSSGNLDEGTIKMWGVK